MRLPSQLVFVYGTRPEAIKLGPIAAELRALGSMGSVICTNQHSELLKGTPAESDLADGASLGLLSNGNVLQWTRVAEARLRTAFGEMPSPTIVVQGDTMTAIAAARAATALRLPVAHVEAGVRSHNAEEPWPEEGFRTEIAQLASWHYAPTSTAFANLVQEGVEPNRILVTGNPGVSAIARYTTAVAVAEAATPTILVTLHRREFLLGPNVTATVTAVGGAARRFDTISLVWPIHPALGRTLNVELPPNLRVVAPLSYVQCVTGLALCQGVLTDSGGLQEEAATLGVPCAVMRNVTDRPESVEAGVARRFPPTPLWGKAARTAALDHELPPEPAPVFGGPGGPSFVAKHLANL